MMPDRAAGVALVLGNLAGLTAAFLLVASCGAEVYQESLMRFHNHIVADIAAVMVPLMLFWIAGKWFAYHTARIHDEA
jgi:hypothetical protein